MKRFFFDEEEENDDEEDSEKSLPEFIPEFFTMSQQDNSSSHVLNCSVRICEQSFFWWFLGTKRKLRMIHSVFYDLMQLVEVENQDEQERK